MILFSQTGHTLEVFFKSLCWDTVSVFFNPTRLGCQLLERKLKLVETNKKILAKEGKLKRFRDRTKQYRQNRMFQNNEWKFYRQVGEEWAKSYQQPDVKEAKKFWSKIWERKDHNKKNRMDRQHGNRLIVMGPLSTHLWTLPNPIFAKYSRRSVGRREIG